MLISFAFYVLMSSVYVLMSSVNMLMSSVYVLMSSVNMLMSSGNMLMSSAHVLMSSAHVLMSSAHVLMSWCLSYLVLFFGRFVLFGTFLLKGMSYLTLLQITLPFCNLFLKMPVLFVTYIWKWKGMSYLILTTENVHLPMWRETWVAVCFWHNFHCLRSVYKAYAHTSFVYLLQLLIWSQWKTNTMWIVKQLNQYSGKKESIGKTTAPVFHPIRTIPFVYVFIFLLCLWLVSDAYV